MEIQTVDVPILRLGSQRLTGAGFKTPQEVVDWLVAVQSQDFAGAKWALGLRMQNAADSRVEQAFNEGAILRTHLLRPTWHFVTPADIGWLLALTAPRVHAANAHYYRKLELDDETFRKSSAALEQALAGGQSRTRDELREVLERAGVRTGDGLRMSYLMMGAELDGVICSGPRRGKQFTYALLAERAPEARALAREEALAELALRYFRSRGPATVQDFAKWSGLTVADGEAGLQAVKSRLRQEVVDGKPCWLSPEEPQASLNPPLVHLLSIFDEYISSYKGWSAIVDTDRANRLQALGNALTYILVIDGHIVGAWRRTLRRRSVSLETSRYAVLSETEEAALAEAARRYGDYLGLPVELT